MKNKKTLALAIAAGIITLVAIIGVAILLLEPSLKAADFTNKNIKEILTWQKENNIADDMIEYVFEFDEKVEKDIIISQNVKDGDVIKGKIVFTVSKGVDPNFEVTLIDFTGKTEEEIKAFFEKEKFTDVTYETIPHEKIEKGKFIKLNIEDTKVKRNTLIVVSISAGSDSTGVEIVMPDFADSNKTNIDAWAKTNNITVNYTYANSDKIAEGKVISFTPKAKETIKTGGKINVTLSKGKGTALANLVGKSEAEATTWMKNNGMIMDKIEVYSEKTKGNVTYLDPKAGSILTKGATVKVYVSAGLVPIDNHVGKSKATFESWLAGINKKFSNTAKLKVVYQEVNSTLTAGSIVKMSFDGSTYTNANESGKSAKPEDTITVQVSKGAQITVADKRGSSETEFKSYITGLKLNSVKGTSIYHDTYAKDTVAKHQTGSFAANSTISYQLSLGKYNPNSTEFENKTVDEVKNILSTANNLEAGGWTFTSKGSEYNPTVAQDKTFNCSTSGKTVSCKVSRGIEPEPVIVGDYKGRTEADFKTDILSKKLVVGTRTEEYSETIANGSIISNDTGKKVVGTAINYVVSKGKAPATTVKIADLLLYQKASAAETQTAINDYLRGLGFTNIAIDIIHHDTTAGELISYDKSGFYPLDHRFTITISKGPQ